MNTSNLKAMSVDKLTALREQVNAMLNTKITEERRSVQEQLTRLDRLMGSGARANGAYRTGTRGPVAAKYRNPENPTATWAGRGLKPRWLVAALKSGGKLEDFSINAPQKKTRGRPKKAAGK
jgi:DNA-binding protein H-NS